jgi:phosphoglycerate dehydrogenase-like enzyme
VAAVALSVRRGYDGSSTETFMTDVLIAAPFAKQIAKLLGAAPAGVKIAAVSSMDEAPADLSEVRALMALPHWVDRKLLERMPRLEWLQSLTAGIDPWNGIDFGDIVVTTMGGVHAPQMSELAFIFMFTFARDLRADLRAAGGQLSGVRSRSGC